MTTKDEALQMALDVLTCTDDDGYDPGHRCGQCDDYVDRNGHVRAAIREALAQTDEQEPVAVYVGESWSGSVVRLYDDLPLETPLYTAPPKRQPLTDVQINHIWDMHIAPVFGKNGINPVVFARAIERAILEKSNG